MDKLLIVEDDAALREQMRWALQGDFSVLEAGTAPDALAALESEHPHLICLDMGLDGQVDRGLDVIDSVLAADRTCKIVAVTGASDENMGREAIRRGAFDFLGKPFDSGELAAVLRRAERLRDLESEAGTQAGQDEEAVPLLAGDSENMRRVFGMLRRLAPADASVLFAGESGTGRETCARALHLLSPRRAQPFVSIQCAAVPESELPGLVASARGGTLFLEGVDELAPALHVKVMDLLEEFRDVRLTASAGRTRVVDPALKTQLMHRLGQCEVELPPLRERGRDALLIARALVTAERKTFGQPRLRLSSRAEKAILAYGWPGNIPELESRLGRAAAECQGQVIEESDLELGDRAASGLSFREARRRFERSFIMDALRRTKGNISLAARTLGVTRPTFYDLMKKNGVELRMEARA